MQFSLLTLTLSPLQAITVPLQKEKDFNLTALMSHVKQRFTVLVSMVSKTVAQFQWDLILAVTVHVLATWEQQMLISPADGVEQHLIYLQSVSCVS